MGDQEATEAQEPKFCPLLSSIETLPTEAYPEGRRGFWIKRMPCQGRDCEFWSNEYKQCSFIRQIKYETILEKIIQEKK